MGETEKKQDLDWMIRLCEPTPSQEQKLLHCLFARQSEVCRESPLMSSLGPTQPDPNHIIILSVPESTKPLTPDEDDDVIFVTPPENHFRSSSDSDQRNRVRDSSQGRIGDEAESKNIRASSQVENTQPVVETQPIDVGIKNVVGETELIVLDGSDSENETVFLGDTSVGNTPDQEPSQGRSFKGDLGSTKKDKRADKGTESVANVGKNVGKEKASVDAVNVDLGSTKTDKRADKGTERVVNVVKNVGKEKVSVDGVNGGSGSKKIAERRVESNVYAVELAVGKGKVNKDCVNGDVGTGSSRNGFDEIDKFAYNGNGVGNKEQGRRKLPESIQGGEGNDGVEKEIDFYDMLEAVEDDGDGEEDVDFVETAKKLGVVFPRPRWWDADW